MDINDNLHQDDLRQDDVYQKVLRLLLDEAGIVLPETELVALAKDTAIRSLLNDLLASVSAKAEHLALANNETAIDDRQPLVSLSEEKSHEVIGSEENIVKEPDQHNERLLLAETLSAKTLEPNPPADVLPPIEIHHKVPVEEESWQAMLFSPIEQHANTASSAAGTKLLRPGQIPVGMPNPANCPSIHSAEGKINIANARVGTPFHSDVDISLDNGAKAEILDLSLQRTLVLSSIKRPLRFQALTESGDIEATVTWSRHSAPTFQPRCFLS